MSNSSAIEISAQPSRPKRRHWLVLLSFFFMVVVPTGASVWYLWARAADRYVSTVGFSVRSEDSGYAAELLGGLAGLSSSSSSDTDILYQFIQSQELVETANNTLDLREIWTKGDPDADPVFVYQPPGTIEDLVTYWQGMVDVYNSEDGLLELKVQAFTPVDAKQLAQLIYDESAAMINRLSAIAQQDATGYAIDELDQAVERLKQAREAMTRFRNLTQIVDPATSAQSQMGLMGSLQLQLAEALIDLDILRETTVDSDPRVTQLNRRTKVIENRITAERRKLGLGTDPGTNDAGVFADLMGEYERLAVDLKFAEESYIAALTSYDAAQAEARRKSRYLAAHVRPTLAEAPLHPRRYVLTSLVGLFTFLTWCILVLAAYALRDRR